MRVTAVTLDTDEGWARPFAHLMMQGKVKVALQMLSQDSNEAGGGGPLSLTKNILDILKQKHPPKSPPFLSAFVKDGPPTLQPTLSKLMLSKSVVQL